MRRLLVILLLIGALASASVAAAAQTRGLRGSDNDIELTDGAGLAVVSMRGALIGSLGSGRVTITDLPDSATTDISVLGADSAVDVTDQTTVYTGSNLRFRLFRGKWRVRIEGTGIFVSAVGTGSVGVRGTEGTYSVAGAAAKPWPVVWQIVRLGS